VAGTTFTLTAVDNTTNGATGLPVIGILPPVGVNPPHLGISCRVRARNTHCLQSPRLCRGRTMTEAHRSTSNG
jgi:hypothetical protein